MAYHHQVHQYLQYRPERMVLHHTTASWIYQHQQRIVYTGLDHHSDSSNPFGNVLVTDYIYDPKRKPAPPAFNQKVNDDIIEKAKEVVRNANPNQPDITEKLFKDLGDQYVFEQSLRPFHSTASTTIPNDQQSFSEFCYGSMVSCKEGNAFACAKNNAGNYNLY